MRPVGFDDPLLHSPWHGVPRQGDAAPNKGKKADARESRTSKADVQGRVQSPRRRSKRKLNRGRMRKRSRESPEAGGPTSVQPRSRGTVSRSSMVSQNDARGLDGCVNTSRSEADEQGRFKSHILFADARRHEGRAVRATRSPTKVKDRRGEPRARRPKTDGRISISGSTDRYRVSMVCGEAKGVMRAYVGYEWTS